MSWVTLSNVKTYMGITGTDSDAKLNLLISYTETLLKWLIWDFTLSNKTERVSYCDINERELSFVVSNPNVNSIVSIDWTAYTWVLDTDYMISNGRKLYVNDLSSYLASTNFNFFTIVYNSWVNPIPQDIQQLMYILISWEFYRDWWKIVSAHKVGDVSINYVTSEASSSMIDSIIWKYKQLC